MKKQEMKLNESTLSIETGHVARQSSGSVIVTHGETSVLVAVNASKQMREDIDWFPLQVEYRERHYAGGKIPGGFFKREARPSEHEILTSRLTDRPIRPLFPKSFKCETQVIITVLSSDGENMADTLAGVGASAALMISDIPFKGPIATVRVGRIDGEFVINPTRSQMEDSDMAIIVSGNEQTIVMVEGEAKLITEEEFIDAMKFAHGPIKDLIAMQNKLIGELDIVKRDVPEEETDEALAKAVSELVTGKIDAAIKTGDKADRENQISALKEEAQEAFVESHPESEKLVSGYVNDQLKTAFREQILEDAVRSDGRKTTDIRQITIETGILARTHGSALFTRGETQAIVVLTMGTPRDQQIIDSMDLDTKKKFFLHYNFPPYCVGETGRIGFTSRREIGHGNLAERAIKEILPEYEDFPYTVRIVSEITESNGSSSMASVCGGSLALMNAGAPTKGHVAGIAMGLIKDGDRYAILSDILGAEDHLGDMDFKVAGTRDGISAIQMDLKIDGLPIDLMREALQQAKEGRIHILDVMKQELETHRDRLSIHAPKIGQSSIPVDRIGDFIGPGGKNIKAISAEYECEISVEDDGMCVVMGQDQDYIDTVVRLLDSYNLIPVPGEVYDAEVVRIMDFGAFVKIAPGKEGLVHISALNWEHVKKVEDVVKIGDKVKVKLIKIDDLGRLDFSIKALLDKPEGYSEPEKKRFQKR